MVFTDDLTLLINLELKKEEEAEKYDLTGHSEDMGGLGGCQKYLYTWSGIFFFLWWGSGHVGGI